MLPVSGARISSPFGYRIHPIFKSRIYHTGIDYAIAYGTPIRASNSGKVIYSGWYGGYGKVVIVDHGVINGKPTTTLYAHMSSIKVGNGQLVNKGDVLGYEGTTGYSTGPHVHFEVRINGKPNNPMNYNKPDTNPATVDIYGVDGAGNKQMNTFYWYKRALIEAKKDQYFGQIASTINMPKHMGQKIQRYVYVPLLDDRNINDQGIDATGASITDEVTIEMPSSKEEQRKISAFLYNLDNLITLQQRELEKLKKLKAAYLDAMFV